MSVSNSSSFGSNIGSVHQSTAQKQRNRNHENHKNGNDISRSKLELNGKSKSHVLEKITFYDGQCDVDRIDSEETTWIQANLKFLHNLDNYKYIDYKIVPSKTAYTIFCNKRSTVGELEIPKQRNFGKY